MTEQEQLQYAHAQLDVIEARIKRLREEWREVLIMQLAVKKLQEESKQEPA